MTTYEIGPLQATEPAELLKSDAVLKGVVGVTVLPGLDGMGFNEVVVTGTGEVLDGLRFVYDQWVGKGGDVDWMRWVAAELTRTLDRGIYRDTRYVLDLDDADGVLSATAQPAPWTMSQKVASSRSHARAALDAYREALKGGADDDDATAVQDLITDLCHLLDVVTPDAVEVVLRLAREHYTYESDPQHANEAV